MDPSSRAEQAVDLRRGKSDAGASSRSPISPSFLLAVLLSVVAVLVLVTHWPALSTNTVFLDDHQYLERNPLVQNPSVTAVWRFLSEVLRPSTVQMYYHPLTMISLMLDHAMGGRTDDLRMFHRTSLCLHVLNTISVAIFLYMLSDGASAVSLAAQNGVSAGDEAASGSSSRTGSGYGRAWGAAMAALLFGLHPLTVESIPWVCERKTLLSGFFMLWCLILHLRYARRPSRGLYAGCLAMCVLAMLSKPSSLPLPVLMLLLDFWPLGRLGKRAVLEKLPFFAIAGLFAVITVVSQSLGSSITVRDEHPLMHLLLVSFHNIAFYAWKFVRPVGLSAHYSVLGPLRLSDGVVLAGLIGTCVMIPLLAISLRRTRVFLTGCLFFVAAILPAVWAARMGTVIAADRYMYLPMVGLLLPVAWLLGRFWDLAAGRRGDFIRIGMIAVVAGLAASESLATRRYLVAWHDTVSLYRHIVSLAPRDAMLHNGLGFALYQARRYDEAIDECSEALRLDPNYADAHVNLGISLVEKGRLAEAEEHYLRALRLAPDCAETYVNLGVTAFQQGRLNEATARFREALRINPNHAIARHDLAEMLAMQGRLPESEAEYVAVLRLYPDHAPTHASLARVLAAQGRIDDAIREYREALRIDPRNAAALKGLHAVQSFGR